MPLTKEDEFRLNILLNQDLQAIRIDESAMRVHGLSEQGEATIDLNANCRDDQYIKQVKELFSSHVLGSPGGYPVYLKRWTRMGQMRDQSLAPLLLLGEPEAIIAVVHANGLTDELARRAWWAMPTSDNARSMLEKTEVIAGTMGKELAQYLFEYLPFENESINMIRSVQLILQGDLLTEEQNRELWNKAKRKPTLYLGFLFSRAQDIPGDFTDHRHRALTQSLKQGDVKNCLEFLLSGAGQAYLDTVQRVLKKPSDQEVVTQLFNALQVFFQEYRIIPQGGENMEEILDLAHQYAEQLECHPDMQNKVEAIAFFSQINEKLLNPIFGRTDAIGTVMQKKLLPITQPMFTQLAYLL